MTNFMFISMLGLVGLVIIFSITLMFRVDLSWFAGLFALLSILGVVLDMISEKIWRW